MKNGKTANIFPIQDKKVFHDMRLDMLYTCDFAIQSEDLVFLYGDLGMGKTTIAQCIIHQYMHISEIITSPTYVYYNRYDTLYHFDLYRVETYEEFIHIGGESIIDNRIGRVLIEWPEMIQHVFTPDVCIYITPGSQTDRRNIVCTYTTLRNLE